MTQVVVTDATVLIYLTKLGELELLRRLFDDVLVPGAVFDEVVTRGREEGYADALAIHDAVEEFLGVRSLSESVESDATNIRKSADLGRGESEAIALARAEDARCLTDDHAARTTAQSLGVAVGGTIYVLLEALDRDRISFKEYVDLLDDLTESGFRISASLYRRTLEEGREIDR